MKVLFIDDQPGIREQAKTILEDIYGNLTVKTAPSARDALKMLEEDYFAAVVSDYQMPEMNGLELLKTLREDGNDIPFIIFTGKGREEVAMEALNLGADRYIQKGGEPKAQYGVVAQAIKQSVEHKNAHDELIRSEREKRSILNSLSEKVNHQDEEGHVIWANKAFSDMVGVDPGGLVGEYCFDIWFDRNERCEGCPILRAYESKQREEGMIEGDDGEIWYIRGEPVHNEEGDLIGMLEIGENITEEIRTRRALEESEKKFHKLMETTSSAIFILQNEKFVYLNRATEIITGYDEDELLSMDFTDIVGEEQKELIKRRFESVEREKKAPKRYEVDIERKDGGEKTVYMSTSYLRYESKDSVLCTAVDISDQKHLEKALRDNF